MSFDEWYAAEGVRVFECPYAEVTPEHPFWKCFKEPAEAAAEFFIVVAHYLSPTIKHAPATDYEITAFSLATISRRKIGNLNFSVSGQCMTDMARSRWEEKNPKQALNLLSCAEGIPLIDCIGIIEGRLKLVGVNDVRLEKDNWIPPAGYEKVNTETFHWIAEIVTEEIRKGKVVEGSREWEESMALLRFTHPALKKKKRCIG